MKTFQSILIFPLLLASLCLGQQASKHQKSDSESRELKGRVMTVVYERAPLTKNGDSWTESERETQSKENFDLQGNLTQLENYIGGVLNSRHTFFDLDGERAAKFESFSRRGGGGPGEPGEADPRFSIKHKYKYDAQGNRIEMRKTNNHKRLTAVTIFKYDSKGNLLESKETEYRHATKPPEDVKIISYKRNDKGETIHLTKPMFSFDYSDYKYDGTGNWISRKVKRDDTYNKVTTTDLLIEYRTITYHVAP